MRVEYDRNAAVNLKHFWLRRALRILPPFYLVLLGATAAALLLYPPGTLSPAAVAAQALHYTNYWIIAHGSVGQPAGTGVYWSLAVEEHFYLLFPWIYVELRKLKLAPRNQAMVLWGLCALVLLWRCVLVFAFHSTENRTYMATDTRIDSILFGCALAVWNNPVVDQTELRESRWKYLIVPGALLVLALCLLVRNAAFRETFRYSLQGAALTFLFIAAILFSSWAPFRFLNWRPLAFIGVLSYSLYLLHYAVIATIQRLCAMISPLSLALTSIGVSVALSWAIYELIEKPCARLRRRLTD
jgi:peptidoglycan/LPS O-acetylase OafA/YrhL